MGLVDGSICKVLLLCKHKALNSKPGATHKPKEVSKGSHIWEKRNLGVPHPPQQYKKE